VLSFLNYFIERVRGKSTNKILKFISNRLFPLFGYKEYYLYEEDNLFNYELEPKLKRAKFLHFLDYDGFQKYKAEQGISLTQFDINSIKYFFDNGSIAFCSMIDSCLVHMTWVALDEKAMNKIEHFPMKIDWKNEAYWGMSQTTSSYKRLGLYSCVHARVAMYLKSKGIQKNKFVVNKKNTSSNQAMSIFQSKVFADGYCVKFIIWEFCFIKNRTKN
jgi:hypothetical protein